MGDILWQREEPPEREKGGSKSLALTVKSGRQSRNLRSLGWQRPLPGECWGEVNSLREGGHGVRPGFHPDTGESEQKELPPAKWEKLPTVPATIICSNGKALHYWHWVAGWPILRWDPSHHNRYTEDRMQQGPKTGHYHWPSRMTQLTQGQLAWGPLHDASDRGNRERQNARSTSGRGPERSKREKPWKATYQEHWDLKYSVAEIVIPVFAPKPRFRPNMLELIYSYSFIKWINLLEYLFIQ